jgi:hypothetical protein
LEFNKLISLSLHYRSSHKRTAKELYVALNCNGVEPTCKCGCGSSVKYLGITDGFREYVHGHASKVHNNWGHNKHVLLKGQATRKTMLKEGTWKPFVSNETGEHWSKGLTKETDERIAKMSISVRNNQDEVTRRSERMRINRKSGIVPTLKKEMHPKWRGGISPLNAYCRANHRLYTQWKYPKLLESAFKCSLCNKTSNSLEVHHDVESMSSIIRRHAKINGWDQFYNSAISESNPRLIELKEQISNAVADDHISNQISGLVLCTTCHKSQHNKHNLP